MMETDTILNEPGHLSLRYVSTYQKAIDFKTPSDRSVVSLART